MAKDKTPSQAPGTPGPNSITQNAFTRLLALRRQYVSAAQRVAAGEDYPDFFVEGSGPAWHERWPEVISAREMTVERMTFVDRLALDDYPDFFVEGSGPPWHERWPEVVSGGKLFDPANVQQRMRALQKINVLEAFFRLREESKK
jgi:hypothetical protein